MSFFGVKRSSLSSRSNGDAHEAPSSDDEMFVNSRLGLEGFDRPQSLFLELEEAKYSERIKYSMSPLFSPMTPQSEQDAIIFTINFCGKNFGELGLFEPDISILNWDGFKSYLYSSLNLENSESFTISYEDEEGDKIPIESEMEYNEALKLAKDRSISREKFHLNINRISTGFPRTLRSLVSSSLKRVNSVGGNRQAPQLPQKRSITTSTSFLDLSNKNFEMVDVKSDNYSPEFSDSLASWGRKTVLPIRLVVDYDTDEQAVTHLYSCASDSFAVLNYAVKPFDKLNYNKNCFSNPFPIDSEDKSEFSYQLDLTCLISKDDNNDTPVWFHDSMQQMKSNMMNEMSTKLSENFQDFVGNLHDFDVEEKLRRIVGYDQQDKMDLCCRGRGCSRQASVEAKREEELARMKECQERHLKEIQSLQGLKAKIEDNQAQLFTFIQNSNEEIKQKLSSRDFGIDKYVPAPEQSLYIEERERVLSRIKGCSQRSTRSASDNLQKAYSSMAAPIGLNAKFCDDVTYPDGAFVIGGKECTKTWRVINNGTRSWSSDVKLVYVNNNEVSPNLIPIKLETACPPLSPGEQGLISVNFVTPNVPGMYITKWCFKANGSHFGDILWCSVEVLKEDKKTSDVNSKTRNPSSDVLRKILSLLVAEKPDFDKESESSPEKTLLMNYLEKSDLTNYLSIVSFLETDYSSLNPIEQPSGIVAEDNYEDSYPAADGHRYSPSEEECYLKEEQATPETEEADSHHFRSQRIVKQNSSAEKVVSTHDEDYEMDKKHQEKESNDGDNEGVDEEYENHEVSEYCDSHSELNDSEEEEEYQSDPLEYEVEVKTSNAVQDDQYKRNHVIENNNKDEMGLDDEALDQVYNNETENDLEETDQDEEDCTEFDDEEPNDDDDLVTESESEFVEEEQARRLESISRSWNDKKFTLQENFKQNVQVKLDFEVISKPPILQTSASTSAIQTLSQTQSGPLTFREQHFTTSGCSNLPPPLPVQVPESDDDFDGVFINDDGVRSNPPDGTRDDLSSKDDSSSTSSFSECEDEDLPSAPIEEPASTQNSLGNIVDESVEVSEEPIANHDPEENYNSMISTEIHQSVPDLSEAESEKQELDLNRSLNSDAEEVEAVADLKLNENGIDDIPHNATTCSSSAAEPEDLSNSIGEPDANSQLASSDSGTVSTSPTILEVPSSDSIDPPILSHSEVENPSN